MVLAAGAVTRAGAQVDFPGPLAVDLFGEALSSVAMPLEQGDPAYLVNGTGSGVVSLHSLNATGTGFRQISQFLVGGRIVHLIPWEGRTLANQGIVAATANPDRLVFLAVAPEPPYFTIEDEVLLEEDPGTATFIGDLLADVPEVAVSLPGIDRVAFLKQEGGSWFVDQVQDTGDGPYSILGVDLDGDRMRELVTANGGYLAESLGVFRRDGTGDYVGTQVDFAAGRPTRLAAWDFDDDGRSELAATVGDSPQVVFLRDVVGALEVYDTVDLTLPADSVHLDRLFDGTVGLFTGNGARGLVDFLQFEQGGWTRRNSYYPGCHPLATTSADFNGDGADYLVSVGG